LTSGFLLKKPLVCLNLFPEHAQVNKLKKHACMSQGIPLNTSYMIELGTILCPALVVGERGAHAGVFDGAAESGGGGGERGAALGCGG
jgi:hypothetical protein